MRLHGYGWGSSLISESTTSASFWCINTQSHLLQSFAKLIEISLLLKILARANFICSTPAPPYCKQKRLSLAYALGKAQVTPDCKVNSVKPAILCWPHATSAACISSLFLRLAVSTTACQSTSRLSSEFGGYQKQHHHCDQAVVPCDGIWRDQP